MVAWRLKSCPASWLLIVHVYTVLNISVRTEVGNGAWLEKLIIFSNDQVSIQKATLKSIPMKASGEIYSEHWKESRIANPVGLYCERLSHSAINRKESISGNGEI
jgi:hypothetical protein